MAVTTILAEQTLDFSYNNNFGLYISWPDELLFTLEDGAEYTVVWDEEVRTFTAASMSWGSMNGVCVGNLSLLGLGNDTGESFIFGILTDEPQSNVFFSTEEKDSHTIAVYRGAGGNADGDPEAEYLIKGSTLTAIANAIRAKTGKSDTIAVTSMAEEITGITAGSVSSEDVCYVTFMSYDGTVEYGKRAVAVGDDCADPIARGLFEKPTRESDVQYSYTFAGWSTEVNGGVDSSALKSVTEDRSVYANFSSAVRYYTITYYDGETVLKTESLAYGSVPVVSNPSKSGYSFLGWEPAFTAVTGVAAYYAQWEEAVTFAGGSWEDIAAIAESGKASVTFALNDTREEVVDGTTLGFKIIGFDHDELSDGSGKAGLTIMAYKTFADAVGFDERVLLADVVNWSNSDIRTYCNETIFEMLPADLQGVIKTVNKISDAGWNSTALITTQDKVWLQAYEEVFDVLDNHIGKITLGQGSRYASTQNRFIYNPSGSRLNGCWMRSMVYRGGTKNGPGIAYTIITTSPYVTQASVTLSEYVPFCFCV